MSQTPQTPTLTTPDPDTTEGPARFQRPEGPREVPSGLRRTAYLLAALLLVAGVPALLVWLSGPPPIPTSLPGREDLTRAIGIEQVVTVLVAVVWLAWLQFVACMIVELLSAVRHDGVPTPVPFGGPSQRLARVLIGGILLAGVVGGQVATVLNATSTGPARAATTVSATVDGQAPVIRTDTPTGTPGIVAPQADLAGGPESLAGHKVYTVKPPVGHKHDNLWDIAQAHLGDGRRYKEIYELNKDRLQPDGRALHLARLIQPGWQLVMPEDAVGVARVAVPEVPAPVAPVAPVGEHPGAGAATGAQGTPDAMLAPVGSHVGGGATDGAVVDAAGPGASPLVGALSSAGLLAACLLGALGARRLRRGGGSQPVGDAVEAEVGLRVGADTDRAAWLDAALRGLAVHCDQSGVRLPPAYAAVVDDERLELWITPARTDAPDPWTVAEDGRRWVLERADAPSRAGGPAAYPAMVCLGRDESGRDVLIDLEASDGPVQVSGDAGVGGQVATALAVQLATMPWADQVDVRAHGLPSEVSVLAAGRLALVDDLDATVTELEQRATGVRGDEVLTGRLARLEQEPPQYLVLATPTDPALGARMAAVTQGGRRPFGIVGVGDLPGAQWRLEVDEAGTMTVPLLDLSLTAHRMTQHSLEAVTALFEAAETAPVQGPDGRPPVPTTTGGDDSTWAAAAVRVGILGRLEVRAPGRIDASRVPLAEEIVAYLACHPGGVHPGVLASAVWPRGVSHAVAEATVERVRDWLGDDADGSALLRTDESGRHLLSPSVRVDWAAFCTVLQRSRQAASPREEAELLRRALRLVRGPLFDARPSGRYSWLPRTALERAVPALVVDAAHRLAELSGSADPDDAIAAAQAGLRMAPTAHLLWRDWISAEHARSGSAGLSELVAGMTEVLDHHGVPVDAETEALVDHLMATSAERAASGS